jgi:hypothetical protein
VVVSDVIRSEAKGGRFRARILPNMDETNAQVVTVS